MWPQPSESLAFPCRLPAWAAFLEMCPPVDTSPKALGGTGLGMLPLPFALSQGLHKALSEAQF